MSELKTNLEWDNMTGEVILVENGECQGIASGHKICCLFKELQSELAKYKLECGRWREQSGDHWLEKEG